MQFTSLPRKGFEQLRARGTASSASAANRLQVEPIGIYDVDRLNRILTTELAEFSTFPISYAPARYDVLLYRVTYSSVIPERHNQPTIASGLLAVPNRGAATLPVVSYQHGSVFGRYDVPSSPENSAETRLMLAVFAGQGYVVIAPDYFGKGISEEPNSYIVKASTQQACIDMLFAAQEVAPNLGARLGKLFISGWSQGGWSAFVFLNKLEVAGIPVTAAAVSSAPVDLYATINRWVNAPEKIDAVYLAPLASLMLNAHEEYYGLPGFAHTAIKPQYWEVTDKLYTNQITYEEAASLLPPTLPELVEDRFKTALSFGEDRFSRLLQDSHAYRWRSVTPTRVYHGGSDEVTPPYISSLPGGFQKVMGGAEVAAVDAGPAADHRGVFLYGMQDQKIWFDELLG